MAGSMEERFGFDGDGAMWWDRLLCPYIMAGSMGEDVDEAFACCCLLLCPYIMAGSYPPDADEVT